jgi:hypothetical protein
MSEIETLRRELRKMQIAIERKNRELDALHYVWCDGGCETGTHRWSEPTITEEVVQEAERNTKRLRQWVRIQEVQAVASSGQRITRQS